MKDLLHNFAKKVSQALSRTVHVLIQEDELNYLTLSNMAQGRFALVYMSHDHLHGSHTGLPMVERVKVSLAGFQKFFLFLVAGMILEGWGLVLERVHSFGIWTSKITLCTILPCIVFLRAKNLETIQRKQVLEGEESVSFHINKWMVSDIFFFICHNDTLAFSLSFHMVQKDLCLFFYSFDLFKESSWGGNYSREETIQGRNLFRGRN